VALTNVVTLAVPLNKTDELAIKFVPFTINVNAGEPAVAPAGDKPEIVGAGFDADVTLKFTEFDAPPPGVGFVTTTAGVPTLATSVARIAALSCVELTNVVVLFAPPKLTVAPLTNPVPFTVSVSAPEPATTPVGDSEDIVGVGLLTAPAPA